MNKRIQELFDKAVSDVDYIRDDEYTNLELQKMYIPDCFAERFAELLVRECARISKETCNELKADETIQMPALKTSVNLYQATLRNKLDEHFGVEL